MSAIITIAEPRYETDAAPFDFDVVQPLLEAEEALDYVTEFTRIDDGAFRGKTKTITLTRNKPRRVIEADHSFRVKVSNAATPKSDGAVFANPGTGSQRIDPGKSKNMNVQKGGDKAVLTLELANSATKAVVTLNLK